MRRIDARYILLTITVVALGVWAVALDLHAFQPETVIRSAEVNENFSMLADAVASTQRRVAGECAPGSSIRVINEDGTVACHVDQLGAPGEAGVAAVNGMTGAIILRAGANVGIDDSTAGEIVITALGGDDGGLLAVASDATLTGDGTGSAPLGLADGAVTGAKLSDLGASAGQVLKFDGSQWLAGDDDDTTYGAGEGLTLSGNQFSLDTASLDGRYIRLDESGGFTAVGEPGEGGIPTEGAGTRLMWYPGKAAFRVGRVGSFFGSNWDDVNVGVESVAMGRDTLASGLVSTAMGRVTTASGIGSTAMGQSTTASGTYSTAMGRSTTASGDYSTAMGEDTTASNWRSTAMGWRTVAGGQESTAMGSETTADALSSTAMGRRTTASGTGSTALGVETIAAGAGSVAMGRGTRAFANQMVAIGQYNAPTGVTGSSEPDRPLFVVGNGLGNNLRSHALLLLANGDLRITGPMRVGSFPFSTGTAVCRTTNGTLANCSSSARYKEDIRDVEPRAATRLVEQLRPVAFRWRESGLEDMGLIAEELAELEPRLVTYDADGEIEGIKYDHLSALLVAALQELQVQAGDAMAAQQAEIRALSEQLAAQGDTFDARLAALEAFTGAASTD